MIDIRLWDYQRDLGNRVVNELPDECPSCHRHINPRVWGNGFMEDDNEHIQVVLLCTNSECRELFFAYYELSIDRSAWKCIGTSDGNPKTTEISDTLKDVSPKFETIYQQAEIADQMGLTEICGCAYRKALEFLMKDYIIKKNPGNDEKIKKQFLGKTIEEYVTEKRIKTVAERAVWLGNDETHYVRKWETKDLNDLKNYIQLTMHWIEMEAKTEELEKDMPSPA